MILLQQLKRYRSFTQRSRWSSGCCHLGTIPTTNLILKAFVTGQAAQKVHVTKFFCLIVEKTSNQTSLRRVDETLNKTSLGRAYETLNQMPSRRVDKTVEFSPWYGVPDFVLYLRLTAGKRWELFC